MELLVTLATTWAPALTAILGVLVVVIKAVHSTSNALKEFKADQTLKQLTDDLQKALTDNAELKKQNQLILENLTKIKDYSNKK